MKLADENKSFPLSHPPLTERLKKLGVDIATSLIIIHPIKTIF
jgi:hypothetical protein